MRRNEHVMPLIKDLNLEEEMVYNETGISYIYSDNILHPPPSDTICLDRCLAVASINERENCCFKKIS